MRSATSQEHDDGTASRRPRRRTGFAAKAPLPSMSRTTHLTPPCSACHYPMLKDETACLRCGAERT